MRLLHHAPSSVWLDGLTPPTLMHTHTSRGENKTNRFLSFGRKITDKTAMPSKATFTATLRVASCPTVVDPHRLCMSNTRAHTLQTFGSTYFTIAPHKHPQRAECCCRDAGWFQGLYNRLHMLARTRLEERLRTCTGETTGPSAPLGARPDTSLMPQPN